MARWPWSRPVDDAGERAGTVDVAGETSSAPHMERAVSSPGWAEVAPTRLTIERTVDPVTAPDEFRAGLATAADPRFVAPLRHAVDPLAGGVVEALPVPAGPVRYEAGPDMPVVARPPAQTPGRSRPAPLAVRVQRVVAQVTGSSATVRPRPPDRSVQAPERPDNEAPGAEPSAPQPTVRPDLSTPAGPTAPSVLVSPAPVPASSPAAATPVQRSPETRPLPVRRAASESTPGSGVPTVQLTTSPSRPTALMPADGHVDAPVDQRADGPNPPPGPAEGPGRAVTVADVPTLGVAGPGGLLDGRWAVERTGPGQAAYAHVAPVVQRVRFPPGPAPQVPAPSRPSRPAVPAYGRAAVSTPVQRELRPEPSVGTPPAVLHAVELGEGSGAPVLVESAVSGRERRAAATLPPASLASAAPSARIAPTSPTAPTAPTVPAVPAVPAVPLTVSRYVAGGDGPIRSTSSPGGGTRRADVPVVVALEPAPLPPARVEATLPTSFPAPPLADHLRIPLPAAVQRQPAVELSASAAASWRSSEPPLPLIQLRPRPAPEGLAPTPAVGTSFAAMFQPVAPGRAGRASSSGRAPALAVQRAVDVDAVEAQPVPAGAPGAADIDGSTSSASAPDPQPGSTAAPTDPPGAANLPAAAAAPRGAPAAAPLGPAALEEMAALLYEPLSARLRAELWADRERVGL